MRPGTLLPTFMLTILAAFGGDPFVGTWKLVKTSVAGGETGSVNKIEVLPNNGLRITGRTRSGDLVPDEKEQPPGGGPVTMSLGADARIVKRPNPRTMQIIYRRNGKDVGTLTRHVSDDGHILTATEAGVNTKGENFHRVHVYEKQ